MGIGAVQDAQARALGSLDEDAPATSLRFLQHYVGVADERRQFGCVLGHAHAPGCAPLADAAGRRCAASGTGGSNRAFEACLVFNVSVLDDKSVRSNGQPFRRNRALGDFAHQDSYINNRSGPQGQWGARGTRAAWKLPVRINMPVR